MVDCIICQRINLCRQNENFHFIHEFEHSYFMVGEHQYHKGYALLYAKTHAREMTDLPPSVQQGIFQELIRASQAIQKAYRPFKMNFASLGNQIEHIHWHLFPRYQEDPHFKEHPWFDSSRFKDAIIKNEEAGKMAELVRRFVD